MNANLTTQINDLLTWLKPVIKQAKGVSTVFSIGRPGKKLTQASFNNDGSFVDDLNTKTTEQLTTFKTNLWALADLLIEKKEIKSEIKDALGTLTNKISEAKRDSIDFTSGTLTQASFKNDGSFVDDFFFHNLGYPKTVEELIIIKNDLEGIAVKITKAKKMKNSIATYGDLTNLGNVVVSYDGTYKFKHNSKTTLLTLGQFKTQLENQGITTTTIEDIDDVVEAIDGLIGTLTTTKADSIKTYGDLTDLDEIVVDYVETNYTFKVDEKRLITSLANFKTELKKQIINKDSEINAITLENMKTKLEQKTTSGTRDFGTIGTLNTINADAKKTKADSIKTYGNLTDLDEIVVDYVEANYTFKVDEKRLITSLANFKTELKKQIINKDSEINAITLENMKTKLEQETTSGIRDFGTTGTLNTINADAKKTKADSIKTYGDLTDLDEIVVDYVEANYTFKVDEKRLITSLANFKTELKKQIINKDSEINAITFENMKTKLEQETTSGIRDFGTTGTLNTINADAKKTTADSINEYGDLTNLGNVVVSYDGTYKFKHNSKTTLLTLGQFKTQLENQGITTTTIEYIDDVVEAIDGLIGTLTTTKADSIKTYGDLTDLDEIVVDYVETNYTFKVDEKRLITSLANFKTELKKQIINKDSEINAITLENMKTKLEQKTTSGTRDFGTIGTLNTINADAKKTKADSIKTYGDLRSQTINVSNGVGGAIKYTVNDHELNFADLKTQVTNQEITLTNGKNTEATLDRTDLTGLDITQLTKVKSIKTYGDLTDLDEIVVDYVEANYTFKVDEKRLITSLANFKTELKKQIINKDSEINAITLENMKTKLEQETTSETRDLRTSGTLNTINADAKKTTADSIDQYGDLTDLDEITVDYVGTNYTFQVGEKRLIESFETFKTKLGNQGITTTTIDDIDDVVETIDGLIGTLDATNANAKKTTTSTTSDDQLQGSESNNLSIILPIVSGVIMMIIVIGVLLKKYFKNKKNK